VKVDFGLTFDLLLRRANIIIELGVITQVMLCAASRELCRVLTCHAERLMLSLGLLLVNGRSLFGDQQVVCLHDRQQDFTEL